MKKLSILIRTEITDKVDHKNLNLDVDFMIGSDDLMVTGITEEGKEIPVFRNGNWVEIKGID